MLAAVLAGCDAVDEVDWAKACADKARINAIRTSKRAEKTVEGAIMIFRDGQVDSECGERTTSVLVRWIVFQRCG